MLRLWWSRLWFRYHLFWAQVYEVSHSELAEELGRLVDIENDEFWRVSEQAEREINLLHKHLDRFWHHYHLTGL